MEVDNQNINEQNNKTAQFQFLKSFFFYRSQDISEEAI